MWGAVRSALAVGIFFAVTIGLCWAFPYIGGWSVVLYLGYLGIVLND